jgi:hypothetical protein
MAYERKHNKGSVFEVDNKTGKLILSGRINIQEWKRDQKDEYDPRTVVLRTENANGDPRLEVYVQLGVLFPADDDKKYAYSGPCGTGKIFAYAEETADKKRFLNLSIADDAQPAKEEQPAAANEPIDDDVPF